MKKYVISSFILLLILSGITLRKDFTLFIKNIEKEFYYHSSKLTENISVILAYRGVTSNSNRYLKFIEHVQEGKSDSFTRIWFDDMKDINNFSTFHFNGKVITYVQNITYLGETSTALYTCKGIEGIKVERNMVYSFIGCKSQEKDKDTFNMEVFWIPN